MKKQVWLIIIGLLILVNFNYISATNNNSTENSIPNITINYPDSANFGEEFNVALTLNNFPDDVYDVRIGILDNSTRIARIWNGSYWQSTYYYINQAINTSQINSKSFKLNLTSCYDGNANVEVKIRDSKNKVYIFNNYSIDVIGDCNVDPINNTDDNPTSDNTDNTNPNGDISLNLDWNGDMENGKDFEVEIKADNLEDKNYDAKIYIYDDDPNKPISQVYDNGKWLSSTGYISEFFKGPGDKSKTIKLRIKDSFKDFNGEATIGLRIREHGKTVYTQEMEAAIDILEAESASSTSSASNNVNVDNSGVDDNSNESINQAQEIISEASTSGDVIHLGSSKIESESIKSKKNIVYESKNESIKKYSIYSFTVLLVIFLGMLVFLDLKRNKIKYGK